MKQPHHGQDSIIIDFCALCLFSSAERFFAVCMEYSYIISVLDISAINKCADNQYLGMESDIAQYQFRYYPIGPLQGPRE